MGVSLSRIVTCFGILFLVPAGCSSGDRPPEEPAGWDGVADKYIPPPTAEEEVRFDFWKSRLSEALELRRLGSWDSEEGGEVIGEVSDLSFDRAGNLYVLDHHYHDLKVFDSHGTHRRTIGRVGRGPGEFMQPVAMEWLPSGDLLVFDKTRRAHRFSRNGSGSLQYLESHRTEVGVESTCILDEEVLVHGLLPEKEDRVFAIDVDRGGAVRGFAPMIPDLNSILQRRRALGFLDCQGGPAGLIVVSSRYFPLVQVYEKGGTIRWTAEVPDFIPMDFTVVPGGGLRQGISRDAGGFHWVLAAVLLDPEIILVQVGWQTEESSMAGLNYESITSYLFSVRSGNSARFEGSLPLVHRSTPSGFLASVEDPFPQVIQYAYRSGGGSR